LLLSGGHLPKEEWGVHERDWLDVRTVVHHEDRRYVQPFGFDIAFFLPFGRHARNVIIPPKS
jgi:hypothetical protein